MVTSKSKFHCPKPIVAGGGPGGGSSSPTNVAPAIRYWSLGLPLFPIVG